MYFLGFKHHSDGLLVITQCGQSHYQERAYLYITFLVSLYSRWIFYVCHSLSGGRLNVNGQPYAWNSTKSWRYMFNVCAFNAVQCMCTCGSSTHCVCVCMFVVLVLVSTYTHITDREVNAWWGNVVPVSSERSICYCCTGITGRSGHVVYPAGHQNSPPLWQWLPLLYACDCRWSTWICAPEIYVSNIPCT